MSLSHRRTLRDHLHERHVPESDHLDLGWLDHPYTWQTVIRWSVAIALISVAVVVVRVLA